MQPHASRAAWLLPALVALAYLPSLGFPFQFDDYHVIVDNPAVHSLDAWWRSMPGIRPLLKLSYALNWTLAPSPLAFRLVNVALHAANALMVFGLLSEITRRRSLPPMIPLLAAALFAVHPVQTEAVTYVSGRSVSMMAFFYLLALLAWLQSEHGGRPALKWLSALAFLCAFMTRETALILPAALWLAGCLRAHARPRRPAETSLAATLRDRLRRGQGAPAMALVALVALSALACLLAWPAYRHFFSVAFAQRSPLDNLLLQVDAIYLLTGHLLLPPLMNADPALPTVVHLDGLLAAKAALLVLNLVLAVLAWRRRSFAGFCVLWIFLHLAPTNSVVPRLDVVNDRQLYLAAIGAYALLALATARAAERLARIAGARRPAARWLLPFVLVALAGGQALLRNEVYRDEIRFWRDVTTKSPGNARAFNNLGYAYQLAGRYDEARAAYRHALALSPAQMQARWNLESLPAEAER